MAVLPMDQHQTQPFTIEEIKAAHQKVKSGADFPRYIQEIKTLGVIAYEHFVPDGHIIYHGDNGYILSADARWERRVIAKTSNALQLKATLKVHQAGKTDYPTFCRESAEIGVEKWIVDLKEMVCSYYDLNDSKLFVEKIPS